MQAVYILPRFDLDFLASQAMPAHKNKIPLKDEIKRPIFLRSSGLMAWDQLGSAIFLDLPIATSQHTGMIDSKAMLAAIKGCKVGRKKAQDIELVIDHDHIMIGGSKIDLYPMAVADRVFEPAGEIPLIKSDLDGMGLCSAFDTDFVRFSGKAFECVAHKDDDPIGIRARSIDSQIPDQSVISAWLCSLPKKAKKAGYTGDLLLGSVQGGSSLRIGSLLAVSMGYIGEIKYALDKAS